MKGAPVSKSQTYTEIPSGFTLTENAVPEESWLEILKFLGLDLEKEDLGIKISESHANDIIRWETTPAPQNRPVAQFGFRYDYGKDVVVLPSDELNEGIAATPAIPDLFHKLLLQPFLESEHGTNTIQSEIFTQCIINVYIASNDSHIPWHFDDLVFGPRVLIYSFGESRPLKMRKLKTDVVQKDKEMQSASTEKDYDYYTAYPSHCSRYVLSESARYESQHSVPKGERWRISITFRSQSSS